MTLSAGTRLGSRRAVETAHDGTSPSNPVPRPRRVGPRPCPAVGRSRHPAPRSALFSNAGLFGPTENPPGLFVGAVWPSFFTATSPARHGRYCYEQIVQGTHYVRRFSPSDLKRLPFWTCLGEAGRRVAVVDVPKSPLTRHLNGVQVVDWGTHDPEDTFQTWPVALAAELTARFGSDPVGDCNRISRRAAGIEGFVPTSRPASAPRPPFVASYSSARVGTCF